MRKSIQLVAVLVLMLSLKSQSQGSVSLFADFNKGDSTDYVLKILSSELSKGYKVGYTTQPLSAWKASSKGILIATTQSAAAKNISIPAALKKMGPEGISITGNAQQVILLSNTHLGLREAAYFYLQQLGYRWLAPGEEWYIVPQLSTPFKKINILTRPDYDHRWISNGHAYGGSEKLGKDFTQWADANNMGGSFAPMNGHSYEEIIQRNMELFKKNPDWLAERPKDGNISIGSKFNVANKQLVDFIVNDALMRYETQRRSGNPSMMISMEPSDGGGFCKTGACAAIGSPSDQAFHLSNFVAAAMAKKYPGSWVGTLAYSEHIMPPKIKLAPNIFVSVTNGFNTSKYSTEEMLRLWGAKAGRVGVYDYTSVYEWDNDMPGKIPGAKISLIRSSVNKFYDAGARVYAAESVMGWVSKGPGQYVLAKLLWNRKASTDSIMNDFFSNAYGNTAPLMRKLYTSWENYPLALPNDNDMADWFDWVNEAYNTASSAAIRTRIDQVKMYLHYVVLYRNMKNQNNEDNFQKVMSYAHRNFSAGAAPFPSLPTLVSLPFYSGRKNVGWYDRKDQAWRSDKRPVTSQEVQSNFQQAMRSFKRTERVAAVQTAAGFVRLSSAINIPDKKYGTVPHALWYKTEYIIEITGKSANNYIEVRSDYSAQLPTEKPVTIDLYSYKGNETLSPDERPVLSYTQSKKDVLEKFSFASLPAGIYRMVVDDQRKIFILNFAKGMIYSFVASKAQPLNTNTILGLNFFYLYVPENVKRFEVSKTHVITLESPTGRKVEHQDNAVDKTFVVEVGKNESGIWVIGWQGGQFSLDGVPPYIGDHPTTMLVPSYLMKK